MTSEQANLELQIFYLLNSFPEGIFSSELATELRKKGIHTKRRQFMEALESLGRTGIIRLSKRNNEKGEPETHIEKPNHAAICDDDTLIGGDCCGSGRKR